MATTFIGGGNMATALIGAMLARGAAAADFRVVEPIAEARARLALRHPGIALFAECVPEAVDGATLVVLAVKPQQMRDAARALAPYLGGAPARVVLSIAAGIRVADLARWLGGHGRIVRAMPNTPALVGKGISGVFAVPTVDAAGRGLAVTVLEAAGELVWVDDEAMLDAVTGVSGSGPAYVFYFLEALEEAARELGFTPADARRLAYATFAGAVALAQASPDEPAVLRAKVTSKGGTTERAILAMEAGAVKAKIVAAVKAASLRAAELGDTCGKDAKASPTGS
jgi:pyrroline-5-carboxylate reductase